MITKKIKPNTEEQLRRILNPLVEKWFFSRFKAFSLPQLHGVMEIHSRNNILVSAPTGATKTLTAFLSILNELVDSAEKGILEDRIYAVYVSPLKALSNDIHINLITPLKEIEEIAGKKLGIRVDVRTGDTTSAEKSNMLKNPPHIIVSTPESLAIMLTSPKFREHFRSTEWMIVDEIHSLAENKRGVHLSLSIERLQQLTPHMTRVGLSATVAPIEEIAKYLVGYDGKELRDCKVVDVQYIKELDLKVLSPVPDLINISHDELHQKLYEMLDNMIQAHKTTLIFTNTRAATERVVHHLKDRFPKNYAENIGAHHGSLSKEHRLDIENRLRDGKLKVVVSSTSLELGIDIGFIDLVILLGSPKSIARAIQRIGRSGHQLHAKAKGRIIVLDRDDMVECAVLLKNAVEKKIDRIHIPTNCLDVLAQQIDGIAIADNTKVTDLWNIVTSSYCYHNLDRKDFKEVLDYLSGKFVSLEDRYIYAKIWHNEESGMIGRRGRMGRVIYMTNVGTIPDSTGIIVKVGDHPVGKIDESFLERLKPGDIFLLGGDVYMFKFSSGMVAQVSSSVSRPPTVPSWFSDMLPLSFDLAVEISKFRRLMLEKFSSAKSRKEIMQFINKYLYVDRNTNEAIYRYFYEQYNYAKIFPTDRTIFIEHYSDEESGSKRTIFHTLYGRRANDCLSRAVALVIARTEHKNVEVGINDNGFYIGTAKKINAVKAFKMLKSSKIGLVMAAALDKSEVLKRRFRHAAARALMILRNYKGRTKYVGRQQVQTQILMSAVKRISNDFCILKEARREVLEDLMDIDNTRKILENVEDGSIKLKEIDTRIPSPFAFNLAFQGIADVLRIEERVEFLRRMHELVLARIGQNPVNKEEFEEYSYQKEWDAAENQLKSEKDEAKEALKSKALMLKRVPMFIKAEIIEIVNGKEPSQQFIDAVHKYRKEIEKSWPKELKDFVFSKVF